MLLLSACLIRQDVYEERLAYLQDTDGDGYKNVESGGDDCDDGDPTIHPNAEEVARDDVDQDCDGADLRDSDGDGAGDDDCDDADPGVYPGATEVPYDGVDQDCDGTNLADVDGDGVDGAEAGGGDCNDAESTVHPGAADACYDGVDADCAGNDDDDCDGDGDLAEEAGGQDCDDADATVSGIASEGWMDAGIDNNCNGSIDDQVRVDVGAVGVRIDGVDEGAAFGTTLLTLPPGWADHESVLLVAAPFHGSGDVYGWRASDLGGAPAVSSAPWHITGGADGDFLGYGLGWAGEATSPRVAIGSEGARGALGVVDVHASLDEAPVFSIVGDVPTAYFGAHILAGYDHDGDGVSDVVASAPFDSRLAVNGGVVYVFESASGLTGEISTADADVVFTTTYAGARLSVSDVGDMDGDGVGDLGFGQEIPYPTGPGGLLVAGGLTNGTYDAVEESVAQLHGGPFVFGQVQDVENNGALSILAASGGIHRFPLPASGSLTPWENADQSLEFAEMGPSVSTIRTDLWGSTVHESFVASSAVYEGTAGLAFFQRTRWTSGASIDDSPFLSVGDAAGDLAGAGIELIDWDSDEVVDLAVGAPGADRAGSGSGAAYIVPGPR